MFQGVFVIENVSRKHLMPSIRTMFPRWVLTTSGLAGASFFYFLSFMMRAMGFLSHYVF